MNKITFLFLMLTLGTITSLSAQRIAIVDITKVLQEMPDYQAAQVELDKIAAEWRQGALFRKRQDLVQPIQERVYGAIATYADDRGFDFIFDKGGSSGLIFSNLEYDKTDDIIRVVSQ